MEKECTTCHRIFHTSQELAEVCPDCLRREFKAAPRMDDAARHQLAEEYRVSNRRQAARAMRMHEGYESGSLFSWSGKLRFAGGCLLFALCCLVFLVTGDKPVDSGNSMLDDVGQRLVSVLFCTVSAALVATSSRRHLFVIYPLAVAMLACSWYMPDIWRTHQNDTAAAALAEAEPAAAAEAEKPAEPEAVNKGRALTNSDLDVFFQQKNAVPQNAHYAVYIDHQDSRTRALVRDALTRLLGAEFTRAYTRNDGALYVVSNVPGKVKNISRTLGRLGHVTYAAPADGVYELRFDADKANLVSRYPIEVLSSPMHSSFVAANLSELTCLDPMRVRTAAKNLRDSNVKVLRREIHDALVQALQDPWSEDFDTYSALAEAMAVYAYEQKDAAALDVCRRFFRAGLVMKSEMPERVTDYLVRESPDEMVEPIVEFWCENPIAWGNTLARLGTRAQGPLLEKLKNTDSLRQIGTIIRYLRDYGDARAIPVVTPFTEHQDSIIRHSAQETINALKARQ